MATVECRKISKTLALPPVHSPRHLLTRFYSSFFPRNEEIPTFRIVELDLTIPHGKVMVILGPSGCGKSTLLRLVAGLIHPDGGAVLYDGADMREVPPSERRIGMVFQDYALYPHFSSEQNLLSFFRFKRRTPQLEAEAQEKLRRTAELLGVDMAALLGKMPGHLSGGEKQRVALGRCITRDPALFLLDEPFSNLDQQLREKYRLHLKLLLRQFGVTTLHVTHDQQEAALLADQVAVMNEGRIEQVGPPLEIYREPRNAFTAGFLSFDGETAAINLIDGDLLSPELGPFTVGVRPEDLLPGEAGPDGASVQGRITGVHHNPLRKISVLTVEVGKKPVEVRLPYDEALRSQGEISLGLRRFHLFDRGNGKRLRTVAR